MSDHVPFNQVDPFTQVIRGIWAALDGWAPLAALVKPGNRVRYVQPAETPDPAKPADGAARKAIHRVEGDFPQLTVRPVVGSVALFNDSTSCVFRPNYEVELATQDGRLDDGFYRIKWETIRALANAADNLGLPFVELVRVVDAAPSIGDAAATKTGNAWSAVLRVEIQMRIPTAEVLGATGGN